MKTIVMLGTGMDTMGGIASVVRVYEQAGMLRRFGVRYLATHCDGSRWRKLRVMLAAYAVFAGMLLRGQVGLVHVHLASRASFWRKSGFFLLADAGSPTLIRDMAGDDALYVLMPMRV